MRKILSLCFLSILIQGLSAHDNYPRNFSADVLHYDFSLTLCDTTDRIEGNALIRVKFLKDADSISFDLSGIKTDGKGMVVTGVQEGNKTTRWRHNHDRLTIYFPGHVNQNDTVQFSIAYGGIPADGLIISKNKFGNRVFFSDHWPDRAHNYLPCIDHPYDKASVDFIITSPDRYRVVANGLLVENSDLPGNQEITHWSEAVPVPVKVMAFGVARFASRESGEPDGIPVWSWVYPENRTEGFSDYAIAVKPLAYYSSLIGPYPFRKLANVQSKTVYGGMENAGTIFYSENSVTGKGSAEALIAHEVAHQWFGDCVTEADWYHVWLSEGFATYLTSMYFESFQGTERLKADMAAARTRVLKYYERKAEPVIDTTAANLMELLNANSYQKGAWVLHMLRREIGDKAFINGLRLYFRRFYNSNALTADLEKVMEEVSGKDLHIFFQQWLFRVGQPELSISQLPGRRTGTIEINIEQKQAQPFEFRLELLLKGASGQKIISVNVSERITKVEFSTKEKVDIVPDPNVNLLFRSI